MIVQPKIVQAVTLVLYWCGPNQNGVYIGESPVMGVVLESAY